MEQFSARKKNHTTFCIKIAPLNIISLFTCEESEYILRSVLKSSHCTIIIKLYNCYIKIYGDHYSAFPRLFVLAAWLRVQTRLECGYLCVERDCEKLR